MARFTAGRPNTETEDHSLSMLRDAILNSRLVVKSCRKAIEASKGGSKNDESGRGGGLRLQL